MKSFYILPYITITANVWFNTEKEADEFVEKAKNDNRYLSAIKNISYAGSIPISVLYEEYAKETYLITLANEDQIDDINDYFKEAWPDTIFPDNWEILDEDANIKCFVKCCECGEDFEMDLCNGDFGSILYRTLVKNECEEFNFLCDKCFDFLNNHELTEDEKISIKLDEYIDKKNEQQNR